MLNPSVIDLLVGVADGLRAEVLDALEPGPARDQVSAAIGIVRRVARALPALVPYLVEDIADIGACLAQLGVLGLHEPIESPDPLTQHLDAVIAWDLQLRDRLAAVAREAELDDTARRILLATLGRMTERDAALRLSPWER